MDRCWKEFDVAVGSGIIRQYKSTPNDRQEAVVHSLTAGMVLHAAPAARQRHQQEAAVPGPSSGGHTAGHGGGAGNECLTCTCDRRSTEAPVELS